MAGEWLFGKFWSVVARDGKEEKVFQDLAIEFEFTRTADTNPGQMKLVLINLSETSRTFLERKGVNIELHAGYKAHYGLLFKGAVEFGLSVLQGTEWRTELTVLDGAIQWRNIVINQAFKTDTPQEKVIEALIKKLTDLPPGLEASFAQVNKGLQGAIDAVPVRRFPRVKANSRRGKRSKTPPPVEEQVKQNAEKLAKQRARAETIKQDRGRLKRGAAFEKLNTLCNSFGLHVIWDNQMIHLVPLDAFLEGEVPRIAVGSGLEGVPKRISQDSKDGVGERLDAGWEFDCRLQHEILPGRLVYVESLTFTGPLIVSQVKGRGVSHFSNDWTLTVQGQPANQPGAA